MNTKNYPDSHHSQGGMKFATQISPLLNLIIKLWLANKLVFCQFIYIFWKVEKISGFTFIDKDLFNANRSLWASALWYREVFCLSEQSLITKKEQEVGTNCLYLPAYCVTKGDGVQKRPNLRVVIYRRFSRRLLYRS